MLSSVGRTKWKTTQPHVSNVFCSVNYCLEFLVITINANTRNHIVACVIMLISMQISMHISGCYCTSHIYVCLKASLMISKSDQ